MIKVSSQSYLVFGRDYQGDIIYKKFINEEIFISGLVDEKYRIKVNLMAISPDHAIKVFQQKYPKAKNVYVIQNLFKKS